jgi:hypothetical protein
MEIQLPVVWTLHGTIVSGRLEVSHRRLVLTSRGRDFAFPLGSVATYMIERLPAQRLRGLPTLSLRLVGGDTLSIASMGGPGSLQDLAAVVGGRQLFLTGA